MSSGKEPTIVLSNRVDKDVSVKTKPEISKKNTPAQDSTDTDTRNKCQQFLIGFLGISTLGLAAATAVGFTQSTISTTVLDETFVEVPNFSYSDIFGIDAEKRLFGVLSATGDGNYTDDIATYSYFKTTDEKVIVEAQEMGCNMFSVVNKSKLFLTGFDNSTFKSEKNILELEYIGDTQTTRFGKLVNNVPSYSSTIVNITQLSNITEKFISACGFPKTKPKKTALLVNSGGGLKILSLIHAVLSVSLERIAEANDALYISGNSGGGWSIQLYRKYGRFVDTVTLRQEIEAFKARMSILSYATADWVSDYTQVFNNVSSETKSLLEAVLKTNGDWLKVIQILTQDWESYNNDIGKGYEISRAMVVAEIGWKLSEMYEIIRKFPTSDVAVSPTGSWYAIEPENVPVPLYLGIDGTWMTRIDDTEARLPVFEYQCIECENKPLINTSLQQLKLPTLTALAISSAAAGMIEIPAKKMAGEHFSPAVASILQYLQRNNYLNLAPQVRISDYLFNMIDGGANENVPTRSGITTNFLPNEDPPDFIFITIPSVDCGELSIEEVYLKFAIENPTQNCNKIDCFKYQSSQAFLSSVDSTKLIFEGKNAISADCNNLQVYKVTGKLSKNLAPKHRLKPITVYIFYAIHAKQDGTTKLSTFDVSGSADYAFSHDIISRQMEEFLIQNPNFPEL